MLVDWRFHYVALQILEGPETEGERKREKKLGLYKRVMK